MNDFERRHIVKSTALAKQEVLDFFNSVVPARLQKYFTSCAKQVEPTLLAEVELLREKITNATEALGHDAQCVQYIKSSKTLIRRVSFKLQLSRPEEKEKFREY
jgi:hypothetical protein